MSSPTANVVRDALHAWLVENSQLPGDRVVWSWQSSRRPITPFISMRLTGLLGLGIDWEGRSTRVLTVVPRTFTVDPSTNLITTSAAHGLVTGDGPLSLSSTGSLPGGLDADAQYWAIVVSPTTLRLAASFLGAVETATPVDVTSAGSGVHTIAGGPETVRAGEELDLTLQGPRRAQLMLQAFGGDSATDEDPVGLLHRATLLTLSLRMALAEAGVAVTGVDAIRQVDAVLSSTIQEPRAATAVMLRVASTRSLTSTIIERAVVENEITDGEIVVEGAP